MAKKFHKNVSGVKLRKTESRVSAERVQWETQTRFNPIRNLSPASLSSNMDAWDRGEIGNLARIWDVMARRDLRLAGIIPKRYKKPSRRDWNIMPLEGSPAADAQVKIVEYALKKCELKSAVDGDVLEGFAGLVRSMMNSLGMKYAVHELIWKPDAHGLTFEAVEVPLWFFERKSGKLKYLAQPHALTGEDIEPGEWMVTKADGLMESSGIGYMFKSLPLKDILAFCDKFGVSGLVAKTDAAPDSKEWEAVHDMVASFGSEMAAVISKNGTELEFPAPKNSAGTTPMEALVEYIDRALASIWHGGDLSSMSRDNDAVGSLAQTKDANTLEFDDCEKLADTINKQLVNYIIKYALGTDEVLVEFSFDVSDLKKTGDELTVDKTLNKMGFKQDINDIAERYGRKLAEDGAETLSKVKGESEKVKDEAAELANVAGGDHHFNQERDAKGRFGAMGFHSDYTGTDGFTVEQVIDRLGSASQQELVDAASQIDVAAGAEADYYHSFGDWGGYLENSLLTEYRNVDVETLKYAMAKKGVKYGQAGTLAFFYDESGDHAMINISGFETVTEARDTMDKLAQKYASGDADGVSKPMQELMERSIVKDSDKWRVIFYSETPANLDAPMNELMDDLGEERFAYVTGTGYKLGDWKTYDHKTGVALQQQIIDNYESTRPHEKHHDRTSREGSEGDGSSGLANSKVPASISKCEKAKAKGFLGRLLSFITNRDPHDAAADESIDETLDAAQRGLRKDFEPMAADIAAALNESDPALRKALLLKIAESPIPASPELEEAIVRGMAGELVNGFSEVK